MRLALAMGILGMVEAFAYICVGIALSWPVAAGVAIFDQALKWWARNQLSARRLAASSIPKVSTRVDTEELTAAQLVLALRRMRDEQQAAALVAEYGRQRVAGFAASDEKQAHAFALRIGELEAERKQLLAERVWPPEPCRSCGASWRITHSAGCFTHGRD